MVPAGSYEHVWFGFVVLGMEPGASTLELDSQQSATPANPPSRGFLCRGTIGDWGQYDLNLNKTKMVGCLGKWPYETGNSSCLVQSKSYLLGQLTEEGIGMAVLLLLCQHVFRVAFPRAQ